MGTVYSRWRLRANVSKSAVMVFSKASASGEWNGVSICCLRFRISGSSNGAWDSHVKDVCVNRRIASLVIGI